MKRCVIICLSFFLGLSHLLGQERTEQLQQAQDLKSQASRTYRFASRVQDSSIHYYRRASEQYVQAAAIFDQIKNPSQYVSCLSLLGRCLVRAGDSEAGLERLEQAVQEGEAKLSERSPELAKAYGRLAGYHLSQEDHLAAKELYQKSFRIKEAIPDSFSITSRAGSYVNLGTCLHRLGFLNEAELMLEGGIKLLLDNDELDHPTLSVGYSMLGVLLMDKQDYQSTIDYLQKSLDLKLSKSISNPLALSRTYMNLGLAHMHKREWEMAQTYFEQFVQIQENRKDLLEPDQLARTYLNLGAFFQEQQKYKLALAYYEKIEQLYQEDSDRYHPRLADSFLNRGLIYETLKDPSEALYYLRLTLGLMSKYTPHHPKLAKCLMIIGNIHRAQNVYKLAEIHFEQALNVLTADGSREHLAQIYPLPLLLEIKGYQVKNTLQQYWDKKDLSKLHHAYNLSKQTVQLIDTIRLGFETVDSKGLLAQKTKAYYADVLAVCWELYQATQDEQYLREAFQYSEKSKALLLQEALNESQAQQFAGIPVDELEKIEQLKQDIGRYQKQIFDTREEGQDLNPELVTMQGELFDMKQQYGQLIEDLEQKYPEYYRLKYDFPPINIAQVQQKLAEKGDRMINYFLGHRYLYTFVISATDVLWFQRDLDQISLSDLPAFYKNIYDPTLISQGAKSPYFFHLFAQQAHQLYLDLLAVPLAQQDAGAYVIIPDGELGYLPFELLLTQPIPDTLAVNYGDLPYVLNRFRLRYEYAANLYLESSSQSKARKMYAGFAPTYSGKASPNPTNERQGFEPLAFNQGEIQLISDLMGGKAFLAEEATEENFRKSGNTYQILHLAMHAYIHDDEPLYSGMVFSQLEDAEIDSSSFSSAKAEGQEGILHIHELYTLTLKASLVVLSACRTGQGKLAKGEGILSLARAFKYAGCPNIVMSLWQVDDQATQEIMESFFRNLWEGIPKDEALRQAKLSYIRSKRRNHPFYWAPFVLIGDSMPIEGRPMPWIWILLASLGLLAAWRFWRQKKGS